MPVTPAASASKAVTRKVVKRRRRGEVSLRSILPAEHPENDILAIYTRDVARHKLLTPDLEYSLGIDALEGDQEAQTKLVVHNLRFVIVQAKKYLNQGLPLMDLIQAGNMGLAHAARKFDPRRKVKFISYAVYWIQQAIQKEIDATNGTIRATQTQMVRLRRVRKLQAQSRQKLNRDLTTYELMRLTGYTSDRVNEAGEYRVAIKSIDEPMNGDDPGGLTLGQMLGSPDTGDLTEHERAVRDALEYAFSKLLTDREQQVVREYYGIGTGKGLSLTEIGGVRDISRERVRQLKERVLRKLRTAPDEIRLRLEEVFTSKQQMDARRESFEARTGTTVRAPLEPTKRQPRPIEGTPMEALSPDVLRAFAHEERVHAEAAVLAELEGWELPEVKRAVAPAGKPVMQLPKSKSVDLDLDDMDEPDLADLVDFSEDLEDAEKASVSVSSVRGIGAPSSADKKAAKDATVTNGITKSKTKSKSKVKAKAKVKIALAPSDRTRGATTTTQKAASTTVSSKTTNGPKGRVVGATKQATVVKKSNTKKTGRTKA